MKHYDSEKSPISTEIKQKSKIFSEIFGIIKRDIEKQTVSFSKFQSNEKINLTAKISLTYINIPEKLEDTESHKNNECPSSQLMDIMAAFYYSIIYNFRAINSYSFSKDFNSNNVYLNKEPILADKGEFLNSSKQMAALLLATRAYNMDFVRIEIEPIGDIDKFEEDDYIHLARLAKYKFNGYLCMVIAFIYLGSKNNQSGTSIEQYKFIKSTFFNDENEQNISIAHWNVIGQTIESLPYLSCFYHKNEEINLSEPKLLEPVINLLVAYFDLLTVFFYNKYKQDFAHEQARELDHQTDYKLPNIKVLNRTSVESLLK